MVSTRGQRPITAVEQVVPVAGASMNGASLQSSTASNDKSNPTLISSPNLGANGVETVGVRLRKRQRVHSYSGEHSPSGVKRVNTRSTDPRDSKHGKGETLGSASETTRTHNLSAALAQKGELAEPADNLQNAVNAEIVGPGETPMVGSTAPDFQSIMANIINHSETVDNRYASQGYDEMGVVDTASLLPQGVNLHLKIQSLPILDNLATQILNILAKSSFQEIVNIATQPNSDPGQAYATLKGLFNHTKKVYSVNEPFLSPFELELFDNAHIDTIRKANMATFVSSVFGSQDVGFYHLNEYFLDTFVVDGNRLLKTQAQLLLDLKTQAYISATTNGERGREEILEDLFPRDLEQRLLSRRPGAKQLAPSEQEFVQRAGNRRKALIEEPGTEDALAALPVKYIWEDFLRDISSYVSKNFESIAGEAPRKTSRSGRATNYFTTQQKQQHRAQHRQARRNLQGQQTQPVAEQAQMLSTAETPASQNFSEPAAADNIAEKAARAANFAMQDYGKNHGPILPPQPPAHTPQQPQSEPNSKSPPQSQQPMQPQPPQYQYHFENQLHPNIPAPPSPYFHHIPYQHPNIQNQWHPQMTGAGQLHPSYSDQQIIPYPTQSAPTQVLYERARSAASSKASPANRRAGHPSQRRPWTADEENSLMAGLDRVKGPHWSQILAMFGPGGTINEVLKDRNQVQLKDKARNLKLFFLKSSIEVPYYLQFVTGELKTRAPAQAAKNEAKDKGISEEDRAHVEGLMTLAGGSMQDGDQEAAGPSNANGEDGDFSTETEPGMNTGTGNAPEASMHTNNGAGSENDNTMGNGASKNESGYDQSQQFEQLGQYQPQMFSQGQQQQHYPPVPTARMSSQLTDQQGQPLNPQLDAARNAALDPAMFDSST